jgi:hypothetical protein
MSLVGLARKFVIGAIALFPMVAGAAPQTPPSAPVTVVNTSTNPVPVTAPSPLAVTGTVSIGNLGSAVVPVTNVDNGAFQPVQLTADFAFGGGSGATGVAANLDGTPFTVPDHKRLVVEYLSANLSLPAGQIASYFTLNDIESSQILVRVPFVYGGTFAPANTAIFSGGARVRAYMDAGKSLKVGCLRDSDGGTPICSVTIIGYLVDLP